MLDLDHDMSQIAAAWDSAEKHTCLPHELQVSFEAVAPKSVYPDSRRAYERFQVKSKAILRWREQNFGVYTADASRKGIRFLSPIEIAHNERCGIQLPKTKVFQIEVVRCRPIDDCCYDCGAVFVLGK